MRIFRCLKPQQQQKKSNTNITSSKYTWYFQVEFEGSKHARIKPS
jgi:hypothetical protein